VPSIPSPPPPYPGFLLHFLSVLVVPPATVHRPSYGESPSDNLSYETLLELSERLGDVKSRGLTADDVRQLPLYRADGGSGRQRLTTCVICLDQVDRGQLVRALPCCHEFHAKCVDRWLTMNCTCPVCRFEISAESFRPMSTV
jgi:hypothetical protein